MRSRELEEQIRDEILSTIRPGPREGGAALARVEVAVEGGEATLTGHVPDLEAREAAGLAAGRVAGVLSVSNRLEIHRPMPEAHRDASLVRAVIDAFGKGHHHP